MGRVGDPEAVCGVSGARYRPARRPLCGETLLGVRLAPGAPLACAECATVVRGGGERYRRRHGYRGAGRRRSLAPTDTPPSGRRAGPRAPLTPPRGPDPDHRCDHLCRYK